MLTVFEQESKLKGVWEPKQLQISPKESDGVIT